MNENITVRVVHETDVDEERVVEYVLDSTLPGDRVVIDGPGGSVDLEDVDDARDYSTLREQVEKVKP